MAVRSWLFVPGDSEKKLSKAAATGADVVILDLEDAVAPEAKETAREQAVQAVRDGGFGRRELAKKPILILLEECRLPYAVHALDPAAGVPSAAKSPARVC